jgi:hypothetical protein
MDPKMQNPQSKLIQVWNLNNKKQNKTKNKKGWELPALGLFFSLAHPASSSAARPTHDSRVRLNLTWRGADGRAPLVGHWTLALCRVGPPSSFSSTSARQSHPPPQLIPFGRDLRHDPLLSPHKDVGLAICHLVRNRWEKERESRVHPRACLAGVLVLVVDVVGSPARCRSPESATLAPQIQYEMSLVYCSS